MEEKSLFCFWADLGVTFLRLPTSSLVTHTMIAYTPGLLASLAEKSDFPVV